MFNDDHVEYGEWSTIVEWLVFEHTPFNSDPNYFQIVIRN